MNRAIILGLGGLVCLGLLGLSGCNGLEPAAPSPTPVAGTPLASGQVSGGVVHANALVVPARQVRLGFATGGRVQEVAVSVGDEVAAGQVIARLDTTGLQRQVDQAQAALDVARATVTKAQAAVIGATADVTAAQVNYRQVRAGSSPAEVASTKADLDKAAVALQQAQAAYDRIKNLGDAAGRPEALRLQQATIDYQKAQALYDLTVNRPTAGELQHAEAQVAQAQARLKMAQADVAAAQAQVRQAEVKVAQAKSVLEDAVLRAPPARGGTITALETSAGEVVAAGAPVAHLADLRHWHVETNNVGELVIGQVQVGQEAYVTANAFPDRRLPGRVVRISPTALVQYGDTTYTVTIALDPDASRVALRWGMTAKVEILAGP
jgi:HlyD family secretion protein